MKVYNVIPIVSTWTLSFANVHAFFIRHRQGISKNKACFLSAPSASVNFKPNQEEDDDKESINRSNLDNNEENIEFINQTKKLCDLRNLKLEQVLNARDLARCNNSPIQPGRVFRTGRLSDASEHDIQLLMEKIELKTLIDLRSPTELKDDTALMRPEVYGDFTNVVWKDRGRKKDGCVRVLESGEFPVKEKFWKRRRRAQDVVDDMIAGKNLDDNQHDDDDADEDCDCDDLGAMIASRYKNRGNQKERLFVPLMNEFKYVKGTVSKLRKSDIFRACLKSPASIFSRRVRVSIKKPFLDEINNGGLQMLNELLFRYGAPGIRFALEVCADKSRHPVAFYCTAGKDRTGAIASIILTLCGVEIDNIVEDYSLSANVYAEMNDHKAMVGALSQKNLDPKVFLGAPPHVMRDTLTNIKEQYGSVEAYCEWIGFDREKQQQLRDALLK